MPAGPSWLCNGCGAPWPCLTKQRQLLAEFTDAPTSLTLYMAGRLSDAAGDRRDLPAEELYDRFLGWARGPGRPG